MIIHTKKIDNRKAKNKINSLCDNIKNINHSNKVFSRQKIQLQINY